MLNKFGDLLGQTLALIENAERQPVMLNRDKTMIYTGDYLLMDYFDSIAMENAE